MLCFIYKSLKKEELYLYLDKKDDFSALPEDLLKSVGPLQFVMELQLSPERKLAREDAGKVIAGLENKGFYVQMPPVFVPSALRASNYQLH
nr:YcgL domain-containing protein [Methylomonas methanica]